MNRTTLVLALCAGLAAGLCGGWLGGRATRSPGLAPRSDGLGSRLDLLEARIAALEGLQGPASQLPEGGAIEENRGQEGPPAGDVAGATISEAPVSPESASEEQLSEARRQPGSSSRMGAHSAEEIRTAAESLGIDPPLRDELVAQLTEIQDVVRKLKEAGGRGDWQGLQLRMDQIEREVRKTVGDSAKLSELWALLPDLRQ